MKFKYTGTSRSKETVSGALEALDETEARIRLRGMQIRPRTIKLAEKPVFEKMQFDLSFGSPVSPKGLIIFTRQLSSLIDSGVSLVQSLDLLEEQETNKRFKKIIGLIKMNIEGGGSFASGLEKHPKAFSEFFIRIVEAGELSGTLDKSLQSVGIQLEKLATLKSKVIKALTYPALTLVASMFAVVFLLIKVIPEIAKLYGSQALPEITVFVMGISTWVQGHFLLLFGALIGGPIGIGFIYRMSKFRDLWDPIVLKIPLFGTLAVRSSVAKFSRTLATLVTSGVDLIKAFEICSKVITNRALQKSIRQSAQGVLEGKSVAEGLTKAKVFPPMVIHMIKIGELTGRLDELLNKVAEIYDGEVDNAVDAITSLLQPLLIIGVGIIIMFLMIAMYMPIFSLGDKMSAG